jgi:hypothetical protein
MRFSKLCKLVPFSKKSMLRTSELLSGRLQELQSGRGGRALLEKLFHFFGDFARLHLRREESFRVARHGRGSVAQAWPPQKQQS